MTTQSTLLAYQAAADLRAVLIRAGFEPRRDFPNLRGDITASDEPFVTLGRFSLPVVGRLTPLLLAQAESACAAQASNTHPDQQADTQREAHRVRVAGMRMRAFHNSQLLSDRQRSEALRRHVTSA
jgi:hypothetical protein